ncbi:secretin [Alsobacter metallidurans]|uniref:Secretin n=1 Tax=Alsobacter metallidurans TaxID=340221 RepID=A0A917MG45_9HYPH|nr:type II and III secretion system protein family protein [Alsobacter metallidurans]GGH08563.1 secretin [Alsobacter metallidurans]
MAIFNSHGRRTGLPVAAAAALSLLLGSPALPQSVTPSTLSITNADGGQPRRVDLGIGKSVIVELPRDAKEVFVANPKVANAIVRSTRKIFVIGSADGQTNVIAMDAEGRQIANLDVNIGRDLNVLRRLLKTAMPSSEVNVVAVQDTIVLTGAVSSAGDALQAMDIAKGFVGASAVGANAVAGTVINSITVKGRDQVMLKVTVAEIQRSALKQLGLNITGDWQMGNFAGKLLFDNPLTLQRQALSANAISATINGTRFTLNAAERAGVMRTLAEPTLTAISGESAKFMAGGTIPVPGSYSCDAGTARCTYGVEYKPVGVALNFTPIVLSEGRISLHVSTDVTDIDYGNQLTIGNSTQAPAFKTRKVETTVELPSGASLASAGLIQTRSGQVINGFPGLMNLPVIGALFRSRDYQREDSELIITVTPYIAKPTNAQEVARPTDGFADSSDPQAILLGRLNRIYGVNNGAGRANYKGRAGFVVD